MMLSHSLILAALVLTAPVRSLLSSTGSTVILNGISYFLPPISVATVKLGQSYAKNGSLVPITVVTTASDISATVASYEKQDDVFQSGFLEVVYVKSGNYSSTAFTSANYTVLSGSASIPIGPYFVNPITGSTYKAYRLYSDSEGAFLETTVESEDGTYSVLPANLPGQNLAVAVPSRLYYTKTTAKPLAGVRLGVKDIYDVAGLHTSDGNRAWYHFYPKATESAVAIQRLIDAGAVIVGKMKTSQFANGETATADWVDYHEPFNPRGDGYQDTSSSSSGPGAGQGAYPWLDISIGSDTGGSIRGPSEVQGLFGNRPSHGLVPLTGVMPLSPLLDTAGFLTRDPYLWLNASQVLYGRIKTYTEFPKEILTIAFPQTENSPLYMSHQANKIILDFLGKLTKFLNATVTPFDFTTSFKETAPADSPSANINELLNITYPILISKQQTPLVRDPFFAAYEAKHHGRRPFIDPVPLARWAFGDSYPNQTLTDAIANKTVFEKWFNSKVLIPTPSSATCSDKLMLYVGSDGSQNYRNTYRSPPGVPYGFSIGRVSPFSGAPDFVVPIGQAAYNSTITDHVEVLPVTIDILVATGCDGMLFKLIQALAEAGIVNVPVTGRSLETGFPILYKRGVGAGNSAWQ